MKTPLPEDGDPDELYDTDMMHEMFDASAVIEKAKSEAQATINKMIASSCDEMNKEFLVKYGKLEYELKNHESHVADLKRQYEKKFGINYGDDTLH